MNNRNIFRHVNTVTANVHEGFVSWSRQCLRDAGLDDVEVYGRFPSEGTVRSYVVCFPYRLGPSPKLIETTRGVSLLRFRRAPGEKERFIPNTWVWLGTAMAEAIDALYPKPDPNQRQRGQQVRPASIGDLPKPLAAWYREREAEQKPGDDPWVSQIGPHSIVRTPSLWWEAAFPLSIKYVVLANDGGRGTASRTSVGPPLALPSLSVIAAAIHMRKGLRVQVPPLPHSEQLDSLVDAMGRSVGGELQERFQDLMKKLNAEDTMRVGISPVQDLTNHDFATLMTALNRPLEPCLNLSMRLPLAAQVVLSPSVSFGSLAMSETAF